MMMERRNAEMKPLGRFRNSRDVLRDETDALIMGLFAFFAILHVVSWAGFASLSATGRLSTSPVVVLLCCVGIAAVRVRDWAAAKVISGLAVAVMIAGRFTFPILGGAPPFNGWNLYEFRCISELMVLILIFGLCIFHSTEDSWDGALVGRTLMPFLTDVYDNPIFSMKSTRRTQIALCALAAGLLILSGFRNGAYTLYIIFNAPLIILLSGDRNNKNFVGILMLVKTATDLGHTSFLHGHDLSAMFIGLNILAVIMAFMGTRENYSMVLMVQIAALITNLMLFCCSSVDRSAPYFYTGVETWGCELEIYICLLLFGYGRGWSNNSILSLLRAMLSLDEHHPDDDWKEAQPADRI